MKEEKEISGFSKLSKPDKIRWLANNFLYNNPVEVVKDFAHYWHDSIEEQKVFDGFSENTLTNFYLPFGVAPNFKINGQVHAIPMVIEESSVVAACANAAKFWLNKGGFKATVLSTTKMGQVHFTYNGDAQKLKNFFPTLKDNLIEGVKHLTKNMEARGGGIKDIELVDYTAEIEGCYQLRASFETCDSMGANFINSVLEAFSQILVDEIRNSSIFTANEKKVEIVMSILSNYTPECVVKAEVSCKINELGPLRDGISPKAFAQKFVKAIQIAKVDPYRATTHNKGIMNGVDAVVIATGNDFRATESCAHAYASRNGRYESLTDASIENDVFKFSLTLPIAIGTVGGLTNLHPMAKKSLEILGKPTANELMQIIATVGLAQNFAAVKSLITTGIQAGHMKMHLNNIVLALQATEEEAQKIKAYFYDKVVSVSAVREFLESLRSNNIGYNESV